MIDRRTFARLAAATPLLAAADTDLDRLDLWDLSDRLRRRKLSPVELVSHCLKRTEQQNGRLKAYITVMRERALQRARELEKNRPQGRLHGIPIAVKDLFDTAGVLTTAGSRHWERRVPAADAEVVKRLHAAGAVLIAKANMDEFAYNYTGETSAFGVAVNPWDAARTAGGSSGGSAVAVAAGLCVAALGSDTGGSIRLPASFCGVTGFKPTYGSVSTEGALPLAWSLDHAGPLCRSARDAAVMTEVLSGKPLGVDRVNLKPLRVGLPRALFFDGLDAEVAGAIDAAVGVLRNLTSGARDVVIPAFVMSKDAPDLPAVYAAVITAEAYAFHRSLRGDAADLYHPGTRRSVDMGASVTATDYILARRKLDELRASSGRLFADADVLITPVAPGPPFVFGKGSLAYLRNTSPWNLLGLPAIAIPCGFTRGGLPVGLQITGRWGADATVLAVAAAFQSATDWHTRRPASS